MNRNFNKGGLMTTEKGAIWNIKVGIYNFPKKMSQTGKQETKLWEIKVILN